jgi:beta-N-acetylhexosaminidase
MEFTLKRRRRAAIAALCGLAAGAIAFGVALGDGSPTEPSAVSMLSLKQLAGERLVVGYPGAEPPAAVRAMVREGRVAGVILFAENFPSREAGRRAIATLQAIRRPAGLRDPLLVMVDQEGGLVKRIDGAPTSSAAQMGARGARFASAQGARTAVNLRDVGVNVDLAPVLDVARPGSDTEATERGFGSSAAAVSRTAIPFAAALQAGGVAATAKHFPGLGSARQNTDFAVQRVGLPKEVLRAVDEAPYRGFVDLGGGMVMIASAIYPALSSKPAAFSRSIATGELRERLGFEGVSITDALGSVAVADFGGPAKAGVAATRAGTDLLLFTDYRSGARAGEALLRGLRSGALERAGFEASAGRVLRLRHTLGEYPAA